MNNRDILEIQNFNRSILTKNSYTRSELEYIIRIYNICLQAGQDTHLRTILNNKLETIVSLAQKQITAFSNGKVHLSPDAYKPMGEFIRQFGQQYVNQDTGLKYGFTPAARRAQIMLNKMNSRLSQNQTPKVTKLPEVKVYTPKVRQVKQVKKQLTLAQKQAPLIQKEKVIAQLRKHIPSTVDAKKFLQTSNKKLVVLKNKVDTYIPTMEQQTKVIKHIGNEACEIGKVAYKGVSNILRRYGVAVTLLWGMCGTGNMSNIGAKDVFKSIKEHNEHIKKNPQVTEEIPTTKVLTAKDFTPVEPEKAKTNEFNFVSNQTWLQPPEINLDYQEKDLTPKTIADMTLKEYRFTKEDLQALEVSEQGAQLALRAREVSNSNVNYDGYCYRGVKRMFNLAHLGKMDGRSAYMAKAYLDKNPHFVRINCNVSDLKYLPTGTVVVFDKGKRGIRPHGHIGVLDEVKGKKVERSGETYNVRSTLGGYGGVHVYIHADTQLPQSVQDNINKIMALEQNNPNKNKKMPTNYFAQLAQQQNAAKHV